MSEKIECAACGWEMDEAEWTFKARPGTCVTEDLPGCRLCAETLCGNALYHPNMYPGDVLRSISYIGNVLLAAIKKG
jgi:hypothetical protein